MRKVGIRGVLLAAGLAVASMAGAQSVAPHAAVAAAPGPQAAAAMPAPVSAMTPTPAAAPASPLLAQDGAPAMAIDPVIGHPVSGVFGLQPQVTDNGVSAAHMHDRILFPVITIISLVVLVLLIIVMVRYRARPDRVPSKTAHNTLIEVIWTAAPVIILALIAIPSIGLLQAQYAPPPKGAITLKAIGNQWYWSYEYPDMGIQITANMLKEKDQVSGNDRARTDLDGPRLLAVDNRVVLPVGQTIRLLTTSNDVIHSWEIPAFWVKLDAVPGRINETSFKIERPGLYFGVCSELCGARHAYMPIAVEAVPLATFNAWVKAKGGSLPGAPAPAASAAAPAKDLSSPAAFTSAPALQNATTEAPATNQGAGASSTGQGQ